MLVGREIGLEDTETSRKVCVISEAMARFYFGSENPLGRHVTDEFPDTRETFEIVGVAKGAKDHRVRGEVPRRFYVPIRQALGGPPPAANFELRTFADPGSLIETARRTVLDYDRNLVIRSSRTLDQLLDRSLRNDRLIAQLSSFFGAVALLLAAVGLYGVLSYSVARRTNEIGIRMALGAEPGRVVRMIARETGLLVAVGAAVGIPLAFAATRVISSRLFGLSAADPLTIAVAAALLAAVAMLAGYLPARRAAKVDPVIALRSE
jgi:predicted permease